jgi:hypothetical protein
LVSEIVVIGEIGVNIVGEVTFDESYLCKKFDFKNSSMQDASSSSELDSSGFFPHPEDLSKPHLPDFAGLVKSSPTSGSSPPLPWLPLDANGNTCTDNAGMFFHLRGVYT